ncbi:hypothetical protein L2Y90_04135 [Burkholderia pyrrocinia]|uniref:hypothetical protein n=1 Tax=Burkholderia pyrrocinia TaxID=60550 RepID=UPI00215AB5CC|nr:hypothetical protein [Burkholderia pyrrocinia]UVE66320.1 hypothetical protein L2Y90_04135 [Burkholderia pyrrocinia]
MERHGSGKTLENNKKPFINKTLMNANRPDRQAREAREPHPAPFGHRVSTEFLTPATSHQKNRAGADPACCGTAYAYAGRPFADAVPAVASLVGQAVLLAGQNADVPVPGHRCPAVGEYVALVVDGAVMAYAR